MTELAHREPGQSLVRPVPVPHVLAELGVRVGRDDHSGMAVVVIPPQVRQALNVIDPVSSFAQADPNWTPRISVVALDASKDGAHFYPQAAGKLAPSKQGLETLAKAAGILYTRTERVPKAELGEGEIGYRATLGIRRSDGTVEEVSREKVWVEEAERAEIEEAVTRGDKFGARGEVAWVNEVAKRWLKELKDRAAKTESKAVLRAIRAALQIPHTFSPAAAAKPFLVIGFNFTPDYSDEETKRLLVAAGLNAQAAIYGTGRTVQAEIEGTPREAAADDVDERAPSEAVGQQAEGSAEPSPTSEVDTPDPTEAPTDPSAPGPAADDTHKAEAASSSEADPEAVDSGSVGTAADPGAIDFTDEPDADAPVERAQGFTGPAESAADPLVLAANEAAEVLVPAGRFQGSPLREVLEKPQGEGWIRWALAAWETDPFKSAVWNYARVYVPDAYQEILAKKEAEAA